MNVNLRCILPMLIAAAFVITSCEEKPTPKIQDILQQRQPQVQHENYNYRPTEQGGYNQPVQQPQAQMVVCPMCNGTGVFEFMPGDVMAPRQTCSGCGGAGVCDIHTAQNIVNMQNGMNGAAGGGYATGGSGRSATDIMIDLERARDMLYELEKDRSNCTSGVLQAQYGNMIVEQRARIRQLEDELRNAY